jgi:hypothetical protein
MCLLITLYYYEIRFNALEMTRCLTELITYYNNKYYYWTRFKLNVG